MKVSIAIRELGEVAAVLEVRLIFRPAFAAERLPARRRIELRGAEEVAAWLERWKEAGK